jgi:hypothetical protein
LQFRKNEIQKKKTNFERTLIERTTYPVKFLFYNMEMASAMSSNLSVIHIRKAVYCPHCKLFSLKYKVIKIWINLKTLQKLAGYFWNIGANFFKKFYEKLSICGYDPLLFIKFATVISCFQVEIIVFVQALTSNSGPLKTRTSPATRTTPSASSLLWSGSKCF